MSKRGTIANYTHAKLKKLIIENIEEGTGDITAVIAGSGLATGGFAGNVTVDVDYSGSDSIVKAATDGTGITIATDDKLLIVDESDARDTVKYINVSQLPTNPGGSDTQLQYNNEGVLAGISTITYNDSSGDLTIVDDKKLYFGSNSDAHIKYNENGDDYLVISGSSAGIVLSGSTIQIDGTLEGASPLKIGGEMQFTSQGSAAAMNFGPNSESKIFYGNDDYLTISGSSNGIVLSGSLIKLDGNTQINYPSNIYLGGTYQYIKPGGLGGIFISSSVGTYFEGKEVVFADNVEAKFGNSNESYIKYDEDGDDYLIISGSSRGLGLSGSVIRIAGDSDLEFGNENTRIYRPTDGYLYLTASSMVGFPAGKVKIWDDVKLAFGTGDESYIKYRETGDNYLVISGSSEGIVFSGSNIVFDGSVSALSDHNNNFTLDSQTINLESFSLNLGQNDGSDPKINFLGATNDGLLLWDQSADKFKFYDDIQINDDEKLYFGNGPDAFIEYNEDGDDFLIISGSSKGMVLSGSETLIRSDNIELGADTGATLVELKFKGNGTDGVLNWYPAGDRFVFNDEVRIVDDEKISFGNSADGNIKFSNSLNELQIESTDIKFSGSVFYFGDSNTDSYVDFRFLGSSNSGRMLWDPTNDKLILLDHARFQDDKKLYFGSNDESYIEYNEDGDNYLTIAGSSNGIALSGSAVHVPGTLAVASNIEHIEDSNTKISFSDDSINFMAGGRSFITITENDVQDKIQLNPGVGDVDFILSYPGLYPSLMVSGSDGIIHSNYGAVIHSDKKLYFGSDDESHIEYNEDEDDYLTISGSSNGIVLSGSYIAVDGKLGVGVHGSDITDGITLPNTSAAAGQIKASSFLSYSSRRYKKNIKKLENPLKVIQSLEGVSYKWKNSGENDFGFIAEDVGKTLPGIVQWEANGKDATGIDYSRIVSYLVEAVKEQQKQIEKLNQQLINRPENTEEK